MDSIRVNNGIKKIEVNENGDFIQFSVTDGKFFDRFIDIVDWFQSEEVQEKIKEAEEAGKGISGTEDSAAIKNAVSLRNQIIIEAIGKIDLIFGENASEKIFCGTVPDALAIADFFEQIQPYIEQYAKERNTEINTKYSAKRKGAKS